MFTDEHKVDIWAEIRQHELPAFQRLLTGDSIAEAAQRAKAKEGRGVLSVTAMAWLAVLSAVHAGRTFADILVVTLKVLSDQPGWSESKLGRQERRAKNKTKKNAKSRQNSKHDPHGSSPFSISEEAFVQARQRLPLNFWAALFAVLAERFVAEQPQRTRWQGFRLLMMDGTHLALPRYKALREHFRTASNGKRTKQAKPQARMVMLALAQARMPLRYELTPWSTHEQTSAKRLLAGLEPNDLVLMDRGFWSYGLFWQVQQQGAYFAIRQRAKIPLKTRKKLGPHDRLVTWRPSCKARGRGLISQAGLEREMTLRVIDYKVPGFRQSAVVTNVLDPHAISRDQWTRMATKDETGRVLEAGLYHRRWEIETMFRELKVEQGLEQALRGRTPDTIAYEVAGHVLLYMLTRWLIVEAAEKHDVEPLQLSFKNAQRELDDLLPTLLVAEPSRLARVLLPRLLDRIASHRILIRPGRQFARRQDNYKSTRKKAKLRKRKT